MNDDAAADVELVAAATKQSVPPVAIADGTRDKPQAERAVEPVNAPYAAGALDDDEGSGVMLP